MKKRILSVTAMLLAMSMLLTSCSVVDIIANILGKEITPVENEVSIYETLDAAMAAENYFDYVNQNWYDSTQISETWPSTDAFSEVATNNNTEIFQTIYSAVESGEWKDDSDVGVVARFFRTAADFTNRNLEGNDPINLYVKQIQSITSIPELISVATGLYQIGFSSFVTPYTTPDLEGANKYRLYLDGPSLYFSSKDHYDTSDTSTMKEDAETYSAAYIKCLTILFENLLGDGAEAELIANNAFEMEKLFATATLSVDDKGNPDKYYNKHDLAEYSATLKNFNLSEYVEALGFTTKPEFVIIPEMSYMQKLDEMMVEENLVKLKHYLFAQLIMYTSNMLAEDTLNTVRDLENVMYGTSGYHDQSQLAFSSTYQNMAYFFGKIYAERHFTNDDRERVEGYVKLIVAHYKTLLENAEWLSADAKAVAIDKLNNMGVKIGGPKEWMRANLFSVSSYEDGGTLFKNITDMSPLYNESTIYFLDKEIDPESWSMPAHAVNAYYSQSRNEIVFPAGILNQPFYSPNYTDSQNLGGIGIVIAHEISHAFDATGRKYDENGVLSNWWSKEDLAVFEQKSQAIIDMYSAVEAEPGAFIDGKLTLDENIADIAATSSIADIVAALPGGNLDEAFRAFATIWRAKSTPEYSKMSLSVDVHAPSEQRVNIVLSNIDLFYETYNISEDDEMYRAPENRIVIW